MGGRGRGCERPERWRANSTAMRVLRPEGFKRGCRESTGMSFVREGATQSHQWGREGGASEGGGGGGDARQEGEKQEGARGAGRGRQTEREGKWGWCV